MSIQAWSKTGERILNLSKPFLVYSQVSISDSARAEAVLSVLVKSDISPKIVPGCDIAICLDSFIIEIDPLRIK